MSIALRLRARGLSPKKRFGQNFLTDPNTARAIAEAATTPSGGAVIEIGPGTGALTQHLLERAARVVAVEYDRELVPILAEDFAPAVDEGRLELINADALTVDWAEILAPGPAPRVVVGNVPYLITGRLLERVTTIAERIDRAVFMVQAEVANRLIAAPDSEAYGALSVFIQAAFVPRKILTVRAGAFYPRPEVDSAVVLLVPHRPRRAEETEAFRKVVRAAFGARRKTMRNAFKGLFGWPREALEAAAVEAGISLDARGETLSVDDFARFARLAEARGALG